MKKCWALLTILATLPAGGVGSNMRHLRLALIASLLLAVPMESALAQPNSQSYVSVAREGYRLSKTEAEALESLLNANPDDLPARTRLLGFYYRGSARIYGAE